MSQVNNYAEPIISTGEGDLPYTPIIEFTEDDWTTIYEGYCIDSTFYSYLIRSSKYGTFWIPKNNVRLKTNTRK